MIGESMPEKREMQDEVERLEMELAEQRKACRHHLKTLARSHQHTVRELQTAIKDALRVMRPCRETAEAYGILAAAIDYKQGE
jgi:hypothetical protein